MASRPEEQILKINVIEHRETGLLVALSEDLAGLYVAARSIQQVEAELPGAIRELFEAQGRRVLGVDLVKGKSDAFISHQMIATVRLSERLVDG